MPRDIWCAALTSRRRSSERAELLAELGRVESALGRGDAPDRLRAAVELTDPGERRARLLLDLGRTLVVGGSHVEAARAFEAGLEEAERPDSELARELRAALVDGRQCGPGRAGARGRGRRA